METTYGEALAMASVTVPEHLEAETAVPVLTGPQRQGDLLIVASPSWRWISRHGSIVSPDGVKVMHGEATGNTHWLHQGLGCTGVTWIPVNRGQVVGVVRVPEGESALLIHTDEHGANGIGPGMYEIRSKREQADSRKHPVAYWCYVARVSGQQVANYGSSESEGITPVPGTPFPDFTGSVMLDHAWARGCKQAADEVRTEMNKL